MRYKNIALIPGPTISVVPSKEEILETCLTDEKVMAVINDFLSGSEGYELIEVIKHHGADATGIAFLIGIPF